MDFDPWAPDAGSPDAGTWTPPPAAEDAGSKMPDAGAAPAASPTALCSFASQTSAPAVKACATRMAASIAAKPVAKRSVSPRRHLPAAPTVKQAVPAHDAPAAGARVATDGRRWTPGEIELPPRPPASPSDPQLVETDLEDLLDAAAQRAADRPSSK
jgi:hypothetical protein